MKSLRLFLLVGLLTFASLAPAADYYDIEVIVFARTAPDDGEEFWPEDPGRPEAEAEALPPEAVPGIQPLTEQDWRLQNLVDALRRSPQYRPLLHWAWRQLLPNGGQSPWLRVRIPSSAPLPARAPYLKDREASNWRFLDDASARSPLLEGVLRMSRSRYLHFDADLLYAETEAVTPEHMEEREPPTPSAEQGMVAVQAYDGYEERVVRLHQRRRMRSGEIHYIDHPRFGILVLATPYEPPAEVPASGNATTPETATPSEETETTTRSPRSE